MTAGSFRCRCGTRRVRALLVPLVALLALGAALPQRALQDDLQGDLQGLTLEEALARLQAQGIQVVYSSRLVRPQMRVASEPEGETPIERLSSLLAGFGLAARAAPGGRFVVVRAVDEADGGLAVSVLDRRTRSPIPDARVAVEPLGRAGTTDAEGRFGLSGLPPGVYSVQVEAAGYPPASARARVRSGGRPEMRFELEIPVVPLDEIVVTPSRVAIARDEPVAITALDPQAVLAAPSPGDDVFRATSAVPGVARSDLSAEFNLRGGRADEVLVELDGVELYEPYHLRDLGSALSIVPPQIVESLELRTGGFSAAHGDRMGGLMTITTRRPREPLVGHLGASLIDASADLGGRFAGGRGEWLAAARQGLLDEVLEVAARDDRPRFWDAFAKVAAQPGARNGFRLQGLRSGDDFEGSRDQERSRAGYRNEVLWGSHQGILGRSTVVDTLVWTGSLERRRLVLGEDPARSFSILDRRSVDVLGVKQDWSRQLGLRQSLSWGLSLRRIRSRYDYQGALESSDPLARLRTNGPLTRTETGLSLRGRRNGSYVSYRRQIGGDVTIEAGLRFDENRLSDEEHFSPRLHLAWGLGENGVLRVGLGEYTQSQRVHELDVADGATSLSRDERAQQSTIGYERFLGPRLVLRAEAYHRRIVEPRSRWENLFDPLPLAPEAGFDRVRLDPEDSRADGFELFVRRVLGERYGWSLGYAWSSVEDRLATGWAPRSIDQPHALSLGLDLRLGRRWRLHADWRGHSGWPTTALELTAAGGGGDAMVAPVLGPLNAERLPDFHRLDLRLSREQALPRGVLTVFVDLLNAYDRANLRGFGLQVVDQLGSPPELVRERRLWTGRLASIGLRWEF